MKLRVRRTRKRRINSRQSSIEAALFKGWKGSGTALVLANELGFAAQGFDILVGADSQVSILFHKQAQLVGEIDVGFVVRGGGEQDDFAVVLLDVFVNGAVTHPFAVSEVVAFINQDKAIAPEVTATPYRLPG